ncbi:hypothetical protein CEXT_362141, partial [Caerostris extrusa]
HAFPQVKPSINKSILIETNEVIIDEYLGGFVQLGCLKEKEARR